MTLIAPMPDDQIEDETKKKPRDEAIICPACGAVAVQEKCKLVCHSEICRGRVVMNCSEF